jgi:hypothetical protein
MLLLSYLHDPDDLFIPLLSRIIIPDELKGSIVAVSPDTTEEVKKRVIELGFEVIEGGLYGQARINCLKYAINNKNNDFFFVCDFDKLLHWLENNPSELISILEDKPTYDMTIIARSSRALSTYPETWVQTEQIATKILAKIIKQNVDFMNGPSILSSKAAENIANNAVETGVGSCVEFCLLTYQKGFSIGNYEVDSLSWEDPDRYTILIKDARSFEDWKYDTYHSLYEWRKRVSFLHTQVEVMIRLVEEPVNPKFPSVQNRFFEGNGKGKILSSTNKSDFTLEEEN